MAIPRIDLTPLRTDGATGRAADSARQALLEACSEIGFVTIVGHGVAQSEIDAAFAAARDFFALRADVKRSASPRPWNTTSPNVYRGYFPSSANGKEGLDIGEPSLGEAHASLLAGRYAEVNRVPLQLGAEWQQSVAEYFDALSRVGRLLVAALAVGLGGDAAAADIAFARPANLSTLRFNHYPGLATPVEVSAEDGAALACETHADSGMLTILAQDGTGGLQVRARDKGWLDVPPEHGALVVNTGRAFEHVSGGRFPATPHRVLHAAGERSSIPFFFEPVPGCPVSPAAFAIGDARPESAPTYEEFLYESLTHFDEYVR